MEKEEILRKSCRRKPTQKKLLEDGGDDYLSGLGNKGREKRYKAIL